MHKYPQNQSYMGSSGQTITTNVFMTPCNLADLSPKSCLKLLRYILYQIKLGTGLIWSPCPL